MPMERIIVTWALMTAQGVRRLLESATFAKPSASKMWFVHWLLGIAFYTGLGVAVYIEGASKLFGEGLRRLEDRNKCFITCHRPDVRVMTLAI